MRLGDLLVHEQVISEAQLESALKEQQISGRKLGATLSDLGYITEEQLLDFLAQQLKLERVSVADRKINPKDGKFYPNWSDIKRVVKSYREENNLPTIR